jgi:hypothetical protein
MDYIFEKHSSFNKFSTVYNVIDDSGQVIARIIIGYCDINNIFYFTEYCNSIPSNYKTTNINSFEQYCAILSSLSNIFELLDYEEIISDKQYYNEHKNKLPELSLKKLYLYDSFGYIDYDEQNDNYYIYPDDMNLKHLVLQDKLESTQFLLDNDDDDDDTFVDLSSDWRYRKGDDVDGFYLAIKDWGSIYKSGEQFKKGNKVAYE